MRKRTTIPANCNGKDKNAVKASYDVSKTVVKTLKILSWRVCRC
jgi:hypothetical protein